MSEDHVPELVKMPLDDDGEPDFLLIAKAILKGLDDSPIGYRFQVRGRVDEEFGYFQARCEPNGTLMVQKECLGTQLGASVFLALQELDPEQVKAEP